VAFSPTPVDMRTAERVALEYLAKHEKEVKLQTRRPILKLPERTTAKLD
jgi:hypothetical protein